MKLCLEQTQHIEMAASSSTSQALGLLAQVNFANLGLEKYQTYEGCTPYFNSTEIMWRPQLIAWPAATVLPWTACSPFSKND